VGFDAEAAEAVCFELRFGIIDIEDLIGVGGENGVAVDEEKGGGREGVEIFGVGEVEGFGEGGEEAGVFAFAGEKFCGRFRGGRGRRLWRGRRRGLVPLA